MAQPRPSTFARLARLLKPGATKPQDTTAPTMDHEQATFWLSQFLGQDLRIHATDGRVFTGQMKCTDKDCNIILALAHEYRAPSPDVVRSALDESGQATAHVAWPSRYVGLIVVPGQHITKIEFEQSTLSGQKSRVTL